MLFTVFTPVFNRRHTLGRVWESLRAQRGRDFEWVVVDDGSTDGVSTLLREYERTADFPMTIAHQANAGKHAAWNRGVALAKGELFLPADSDDRFVPETLERLRDLWLSIPKAARPAFSGVNVLCRDPESGAIVGTPFPRSPMVSQNLELAYVHRVRGEKWGCVRTDVLRENPFPVGEALPFVAESYVWFAIARRYKALCVNEALRYYYRDEASSLIARRLEGGWAARLRRQPTARYFYNRWHLGRNLDYLARDPAELAKTLVSVWTSGLLSGASVRQIVRDGGGAWPRALLLASLPAGALAFACCRAGGESAVSRNERVRGAAGAS
jgi:glycosyltransferase involved in cell wall biosynthesis